MENAEITVIDEEARAGTKIIADGFFRKHDQVRRLVEKYQKEFEKIAVLKTGITKAKTKDFQEYFLTESQFLFLGSLMRNNPQIVEFKLKLIIEFERCKKQLAIITANQNNAQWLELRSSGKISRRVETGKIKEFIEYATAQGSTNAQRYYANISTMENKALFIVEQRYKNIRDVLGLSDLSMIQNADHIVAKALIDGMDQNLNYKDIYKLAKERVEMFAEIRGKSSITELTKTKKLS